MIAVSGVGRNSDIFQKIRLFLSLNSDSMYPDDKTSQSHGLEGGVEVVNKWQFPYEESGCIGNKYINT